MIATNIDRGVEGLARSYWSPHFLLRLGGLPIEKVMELRTPRTVAWAAEVLDLEERMHSQGPALVDVLFAVVKATTFDPETQRVMLSLKRDIYNRRLPKNLDACLSHLDRLDAASAGPLAEWLGLAGRYTKLLQAGDAILSEELQSKRALLKETLKDPVFRKGLFMASESTERSLDSYVAAPNDAQSRRLRLSERSALLYVYRTACKTSPFSTLTPVAWGLFERGGANSGADVQCLIPNGEIRTSCSLNVAIMSRLAHFLLQREDIVLEMAVRLNPTWSVENKRLRYVRRIFTVNDAFGPQTIDGVKVTPYYLPLSSTIMQVIELLSDGEPMRVRELIARVVADLQSGGGETEVRGLVRLLIELGLLTNPDLRVSASADSCSLLLAALRSRMRISTRCAAISRRPSRIAKDSPRRRPRKEGRSWRASRATSPPRSSCLAAAQATFPARWFSRTER